MSEATATDKDSAKKAAFIRLANKRIPKALTSIRLVGNLASYPHSPGHRDKIISVFKNALEDLEYRFGGEKEEKKKAEFELEDEEF